MSSTVNAHGTHTSGQRSIILNSRFQVKPIVPHGQTTQQEYESGDFRLAYQWSEKEIVLSATYFDGKLWSPLNTYLHNRLDTAVKDQGYDHFLMVPPDDQPVLIPLSKQAE